MLDFGQPFKVTNNVDFTSACSLLPSPVGLGFIQKYKFIPYNNKALTTCSVMSMKEIMFTTRVYRSFWTLILKHILLACTSMILPTTIYINLHILHTFKSHRELGELQWLLKLIVNFITGPHIAIPAPSPQYDLFWEGVRKTLSH